MKKWVLYLIGCLFVCFNLDPDRTCKPTEFLCTSTFRCIPKVWLCDGDSDCPNNEDEDVALGCSMCQTLLSSGVNFQKLVIVWFFLGTVLDTCRYFVYSNRSPSVLWWWVSVSGWTMYQEHFLLWWWPWLQGWQWWTSILL